MAKIFANPEEAFEQVTPAIPPQASEAIAITTRSTPVFIRSPISEPSSILFISFAVINGMIHSMTASPRMNINVRIDESLYSRILLKSLFIIKK